MRLLITADLHWNHSKSHQSAATLIDEINARDDLDALLVIGDVGVADGDSIETCLSRFTFSGPRLFVPGNHELWTKRDGVDLLGDELPRRIAEAGWRWLPGAPFIAEDIAVVGSIGWYDYQFAEPLLEIPREFYAAKASPGAVLYAGEPASLLEAAGHSRSPARELVARWNDGKFVHLGVPDETVVKQECDAIGQTLESLRASRSVLVATHTVPFAALLPPNHGAQWDFARAYLGSPLLGETIAAFANVTHAVCGHSHFPMEATIGSIRGINIGSGYRIKRSVVIDL